MNKEGSFALRLSEKQINDRAAAIRRMKSEFFTIAQIASVLGIHRHTVRQFIEAHIKPRLSNDSSKNPGAHTGVLGAVSRSRTVDSGRTIKK